MSQTTPTAEAFAQRPTEERRTSSLAIAALVLGIIGISLLAIIFGAVALGQTSKDPNLSGRGLAITGLILGIIGFIGTLIIIGFFVVAASL